MWLLGALFLVVGLGFSLFMGSLYARLETGNRFIDLSIDMFCIAGLDGFFEFESVCHHKPESLRVRHSPKSLASTPGQEALDKVKQTSPDLVLLDIQMPVLDGYEVRRRIRGNARFAALRVLAVTGFAMQGNREQALGARLPVETDR